jgi:L-ascorbate metabolism protein UlaG (beta-lactamase superfamily)
MLGMRITLLGHSGYLVEGKNTCLVFDYYTDELGLLERLSFGKKDIVFFVTHGHHDHFNPAIFNYAGYDRVAYVLSRDISADLPGAVMLAKGQTAEVFGVSVRAYGSTDEGVSFLAGFEGRTVFHAGDLNDWYWEEESSATELKRDEQWFLDEIAPLEGMAIDAAMLPVDARLGRHALKGPMQFALSVRPQWILPMHLNGGTALPAQLRESVEVSGLKVSVAQLAYPGDSVTIDE